MREIGDIVQLFEHTAGRHFALATLVEIKGSSYRRPGARMLITAGGKTVGSLSGGCLEEEVVQMAGEVLRTGNPVVMNFDTYRKFGCNGALRILVERVDRHFLEKLAGHYHLRRPCTIVSAFEGDCGSRLVEGPFPVLSGEFYHLVEPDLQFLMIGGGPESAAMLSMASSLGWHVRCHESANELAAEYDRRTVGVIKTHNYGRDFAALRALLPLQLPYIGLIGPRARRERLLGDLLDTGIVVGRNLFAPAGLDLGGDSPESVALAVIAEIQAVLAGGSCESLRDRKTPIHAARIPSMEVPA